MNKKAEMNNKRQKGYFLRVLGVILFLLICFLLLKGGIISGALAKDIDSSINNFPHNQARFIPDEIVVKFKKNIPQEKINSILAKHNTKIKSSNHNAKFLLLEVQDSDTSIDELVKKFKNYEEVEYAEPNYLITTCSVPNDLSQELWGLHNTGQTGGFPDADIDAPEAWDIQTGGPSVIVAVIDTGIDYTHEDLSSNIWSNAGEIAGNGIDDDNNGYIDDSRGWDFVNTDNDPMDNNSHGTHCAGIIAAEGNNEIGVVGVNWAAQLMSLKVFNAAGSGTTYDAALAILYATQMGARIINCSWGGAGNSEGLKEAIEIAHDTGTIVIAAAGNNAENNDIIPYYPASYDVANIIAVAATDYNDELAPSSNYGDDSVGLAAPGVNILSTVLNNGYGYKSGTSMATPYVAGVAALLAAEYPDLSIEGIKAGILNSVDAIPSLEGKMVSGGRLNAYSALINTVPPPPLFPVTVFQDDMENGLNGWSISADSLWHQSTHRYESPDTSWYYGIEGSFTYGTVERNLGSLTSPPMDLTTIKASTLIFTHFLETENNSFKDIATVRITKDGGITYTDIFSKTTTAGIFVEEILDISDFDGYVVQIQFFFDTLDEFYNTFEGWYVDDVTIKGETTGPLPNQHPVADAGDDQTVVDMDGDGEERVTLDGSGSYDIDGAIISYDWDFGDNTSHETGKTISHVYSAGGIYSAALTVTDDEGITDTDTCMVIIDEKPSNIMHVGDISMSVRDSKKGKKNIFTYAIATITILDADDSPVEGASVVGHWSGLTSDIDSGLTDLNGKVSLNSDQRKNAKGTFTLTVDEVTLDAWTYDPSENVEDSDSISIMK